MLPVLWFAVTRALLYPSFPENHALVGDWYAHSIYVFSFAFGIGLAGSRTLWADIARQWRWAGLAALTAWVVVAWFDLAAPGDSETGATGIMVLRTVRAVQAWGAIIALLGLAQHFLNHDHPWRATLNEAVFPAYIAHQTVILLAMFWIVPLHLPALVEFGILLVATVVGSAALYLAGREFAWLRPLIGLRMRAPGFRSLARA